MLLLALDASVDASCSWPVGQVQRTCSGHLPSLLEHALTMSRHSTTPSHTNHPPISNSTVRPSPCILTWVRPVADQLFTVQTSVFDSECELIEFRNQVCRALQECPLAPEGSSTRNFSSTRGILWTWPAGCQSRKTIVRPTSLCWRYRY